MSEQKKRMNRSAETVDWAEKLKASMSESSEEDNIPASIAEEDDLAALLRAQLAHGNQPTEASCDDLDTSEFEDEDTAAEKSEGEAVEEPEADEEIEIAEESESDEEIDAVEESEVEETIEVTEESEIVEAPDYAESPAAEYGEADLPWDGDDTPDPIPEAVTVTVYTADGTAEESAAEDDTAEYGEAAEPAEESGEEPAATPARGFTVEPVPYDETAWGEDAELPSPDGRVGDARLLAADEESARLLEEVGAYAEEPSAEPLSAETDGPLPAEESSERPAETSVGTAPPARPRPDDPLQMGLDDLFPCVETLAPMEPPAAGEVRHAPADYTARMSRSAREETERDTELYLELGYEGKLTRSEQQAAVEEARRRAVERESAASRAEASAVRVRREYTHRKQAPAIDRAYTRARRLGLTRLCVAAVGALFGVLHDYLGGFLATKSFLTYADSVLYPIVGLLWTVLVCLPFASRLGRGVKSLFAFEPTRYSVSALALSVATVHGVLAVFTRGFCLYGGVALFMLTVAAASEYAATVAEHDAFSVVSSGKTAFVLTDETTSASSARAETAPDERTLTAVRTGRVSDYFARTGRYNPYMGRLNYLLPVALLAAILSAGLAVLKGGTLLRSGVPAFTATYLACLPAAYAAAMSLPLLRANRVLREKGAAVIGTAAPCDYAGKGSTRLLIRDGDAVGGLYRKEITLRDDPDAALWRQKAGRIFRLLECPLWNPSPLGEDDVDGLCVEIAETEEGYTRLYLVDLQANGTTEVMMGDREALARRGIRLPKASMERVYKKTEDSQVIYLAFDRKFRIAYAVEYRVGRTFVRAVEKLASLGDTAALVTYDPFVGPELLKHSRLQKCPAVELLRPTYAETVREARSGGVVATGRSLDLLYPYAACHRMRTVYRISHLVSWLAVLAGAGLSISAVLLGHAAVLSSAAVTAWQIILAAVSVAVSLLTVTRRSLFVAPDKTGHSSPNKSGKNENTLREPATEQTVAEKPAKPQTKTDKDRTTS